MNVDHVYEWHLLCWKYYDGFITLLYNSFVIKGYGFKHKWETPDSSTLCQKPAPIQRICLVTQFGGITILQFASNITDLLSTVI